MFVSRDNGARKHFQKPNILRRKAKVKRNKHEKSSALKPLEEHSDVSVDQETSNVNNLDDQQKQYFNTDSININILDSNIKYSSKINTSIDMPLFVQSKEQTDNKCSQELNTINIESFFVDGKLIQGSSKFHAGDSVMNNDVETETNSKQCLNFIGSEFKEATNDCSDGSQIHNIITQKIVDSSIEITAVPPQAVSLLKKISIQESEKHPDNLNNHGSFRTVKYKCDEPNCNKGFWSEARLHNHKASHLKSNSDTPVEVLCPAKKTTENGTETQCGRTFTSKSDLLNHINESHTLDDALYKCSVCERRFFWGGGARSHEHRGCGRVFACTWAGCARVFRQPCRLREHARAHTGDRPYPCHHPNCGWSFRSASKLMRHMRRHTGERRHACADCGRAFLRREHLRDHVARHHQPRHTPCRHHGCNKTFNNANLLCVHMKNAHQKESDKKPATASRRRPKAKKDAFLMETNNESSKVEIPDEMASPDEEVNPPQRWVIELIGSEDASVMQVADMCHVTSDVCNMSTDACQVTSNRCEGGEACEVRSDACDATPEPDEHYRSARTHCTWPLQREQPQYVLEDHMQTEQPDGSESNIYTVRSDLFLHGNVLINEDSEFTMNRESSSGGPETETRSTHLDSLGLIDAHPTIDLMQDELMYADTAVDESSFRVFMLNGEELT